MKKDMIQNAMSDQNADVIIDKVAITKINGMIYRDPMHECGGILLGNVSQDAVTGKYTVHVTCMKRSVSAQLVPLSLQPNIS